jgi:DNA-binding MarR family transcriptional regulator
MLLIVADDTRWLTPDEMRIWRGFLEVNARVTTYLTASIKRETGLTLDDYEVLIQLSENEEHRMRMTELSQRLVHSQSRLTQRVDRLSKRGLVRREKCPEDRRGTFAVLTPEGFDLVVEYAPTHLADVRAIMIDQVKPAEQALVADLLERIATNAAGLEANDVDG